ncbi:MAG: hypothetical protein ACRC9O_09495 [Plesiomonas sp.]|uniref:hypothetical protein n=1 Tax=Plesiomonas sp. TaxID=2486279 RepID=UPI003F39BD4A
MAKSPAERKREQRLREKMAAENAAVNVEHRVVLTISEHTYQQINLARQARRPGAEPYGVDEYFELLAIEDTKRLKQQLDELAQQQCVLCGDVLPGEDKACCRGGEYHCGQRTARRALILKTV